jgi:hypothetical protein
MFIQGFAGFYVQKGFGLNNLCLEKKRKTTTTTKKISSKMLLQHSSFLDLLSFLSLT